MSWAPDVSRRLTGVADRAPSWVNVSAPPHPLPHVSGSTGASWLQIWSRPGYPPTLAPPASAIPSTWRSPTARSTAGSIRHDRVRPRPALARAVGRVVALREVVRTARLDKSPFMRTRVAVARRGGVPERPIGPAWKVGELHAKRVPWVRIPPSPPCDGWRGGA